MWDDEAVGKLSGHPMVVRLVCMGTVLAVELRDASTAGFRVSAEGTDGSGFQGGESVLPFGGNSGSSSGSSRSGDGVSNSSSAHSAKRYAAGGAMDVVARLRSHHAISARPLGNVVYLMVTPTTNTDSAASLLASLTECLDACVAGDVLASGQETSVV